MTVTYAKVVRPSSYNNETQIYTPEVREDVTEFAGVTLGITSGYTQIMSDVWEMETFALIWDIEAQKPTSIRWIKSGEADATPEVIEAYRQYLIGLEVNRLTEKAEEEAQKPVKGCTVTVVSGRTAKGLTGKVVVVITKPYGMGYQTSMENKLAIAKDDETEEVPAANGKVYTRHKNVEWVWARNVKRLDVAPVDQADILERATAKVDYEIKSVLK